MYIHAPVLIQTANGFTFGVVEAKITTETAKETYTTVDVFLFCRNCTRTYDEKNVHPLDLPSAYGSYGIHAVVEAHPGYKWAIAESERRINEPELPLETAASASATEGGAK